MFEGFPGYSAAMHASPAIAHTAESLLSEMPSMRYPDDRFTAIARLRFVMEDPGQLLANCVASYIVDQLCACGNRPGDVIIPGFSHVNYPPAPQSNGS
jgi:hypothetical protein